MVLCGGEPPRDSWQVAGCGHGGFGHRDCRASQDCALRVARCRRFASAAANPPSATHRPLSTPPGRGAVRPLESGRGRQGDPRALDGSCPCPPCSPPPTRTVSLPVRVAPTRCQRLMVCLGGGAAGCHSRQCANEVRLATSRPPSSVAGGRSKKKKENALAPPRPNAPTGPPRAACQGGWVERHGAPCVTCLPTRPVSGAWMIRLSKGVPTRRGGGWGGGRPHRADGRVVGCGCAELATVKRLRCLPEPDEEAWAPMRSPLRAGQARLGVARGTTAAPAPHSPPPRASAGRRRGSQCRLPVYRAPARQTE